jgi:vacuolar-type H+-ATPase subunit I/STV1
MNHKILSKVQEQKEEKIDLIKSIKDLEMELEFMYSREPDEIKYISSLEKQIDELYEKLDKISDENN